MSFDIDIRANGCHEFHRVNFTYNYSPCLREIGLPPWAAFHGRRCREVRWLFEYALHCLNETPALATKISGSGQWGTLESLKGQLDTLIGICADHPKARLTVS